MNLLKNVAHVARRTYAQKHKMAAAGTKSRSVDLLVDLLSGVTLTLVSVPTSVAYATLAG